MSTTRRTLRAFIAAMTAFQTVAHAQGAPPAIDLVPSDAIACAEFSRPREVLDLLSGEQMTRTITALPFYRKLTSDIGFGELQAVLNIVEISLGVQWRDGLKTLTGGGVTVAVCPNEVLLLIIESEDASLLTKTHDLLVSMVRGDARDNGRPDPVETGEFMGVAGWSFDGKEAHAIIGNRFILSSSAEGLKRALATRAGDGASTLASREDYRQAREAAGAESAARAFADFGLLKGLPGLAKALEQDKSNPLAALFLSGIMAAARDSDWLGLGLDVEGDSLCLRACIDGQAYGPGSPASFAEPATPEEGAMPALRVPRRIGALSFHRDLYSFYSAKDDLFPERTSQLIFFENMMGIFFSGRDLTSEVLVEATPELRFVIAEQQYDPVAGIPQAQVPAFAAVLRLHETESFDEVLEEAWQKAVGLINFTRGQQAMPGLIIDRPLHQGSNFTVAYFSTAGLDVKTDLHTRFNFRPSIAMPGEYLILSSTDGLARDVMDALAAERGTPRQPLAGTHSLASVDGGQLASILQANRAGLVRQNMVEKGHTQEEAESETDVLVALASLVENVDLSIGRSEDATEARLTLALALGEPQSL